MTGPPTPPLTTPTEIEDEARSSLLTQTAQEPVAVTTAPKQTPFVATARRSALPNTAQPRATYESALPTLAGLAEKGELRELIRVAERSDLSVRH